MLEQVRDKKNPRRASDTARKKSEIEFRRLLEKLPAGAYTCDPEGLITYYNQHAVRVWGRAPKLNDPVDRFCGSFKLFAPDGAPIAHDTGLLVAVTGYGFDQDRQRSIQEQRHCGVLDG